eukprot:scaffold2633_cov156-Amphora_coffeaeformis.AAC.6
MRSSRWILLLLSMICPLANTLPIATAIKRMKEGQACTVEGSPRSSIAKDIVPSQRRARSGRRTEGCAWCDSF